MDCLSLITWIDNTHRNHLYFRAFDPTRVQQLKTGEPVLTSKIESSNSKCSSYSFPLAWQSNLTFVTQHMFLRVIHLSSSLVLSWTQANNWVLLLRLQLLHLFYFWSEFAVHASCLSEPKRVPYIHLIILSIHLSCARCVFHAQQRRRDRFSSPDP